MLSCEVFALVRHVQTYTDRANCGIDKRNQVGDLGLAKSSLHAPGHLRVQQCLLRRRHRSHFANHRSEHGRKINSSASNSSRGRSRLNWVLRDGRVLHGHAHWPYFHAHRGHRSDSDQQEHFLRWTWGDQPNFATCQWIVSRHCGWAGSRDFDEWWLRALQSRAELPRAQTKLPDFVHDSLQVARWRVSQQRAYSSLHNADRETAPRSQVGSLPLQVRSRHHLV